MTTNLLLSNLDEVVWVLERLSVVALLQVRLHEVV